MLIATAGHVDHGKTTLVGALTGVDTDRLPEEKRRGVSIDLGFAYDTLGTSQTLGFIDVPGHEKFVRNMLAGVGAVDAVMLVVAADDGPMPQTREHLAILDLLGIPAGLVALTRADLVDDQQLARAQADCQALLAPTSLAHVPVIPVSAVTGLGMDVLRSTLVELSERTARRSVEGRFRLAIDRHFSIPGSGLVVTGTVFSGEIAVGETVNLAPHGVSARVRGLHVQNETGSMARAGLRCAINLNATDLGRAQPKRGDWLTGDPAPVATRRLDVKIHLLPSEQRPLAHWTPVHLHHGAGSFAARVALLEERRVDPGSSALAQLVLDADTTAVHGDRLILRDQSAKRTIGGGTVIDPFGPARGRARPNRIAVLQAMQSVAPQNAFDSMLAVCEGGVNIEQLGQTWNLAPAHLAELVSATPAQVVTVRRGHSITSEVCLPIERWDSLLRSAIALVSDWHKQHPDQPGPTELEIRRALGAQAPREIAIACIADLITRNELTRQGPRLKLPGFSPAQSAQQQALWEKCRPFLDVGVLRPPVVTDLSKQLNIGKAELDRFLSSAAQRGQLTRFAPNRYYHPQALARLAAIAEQLGSTQADGFDAKAYRDASGIGRNLTIEVLEYFDNHKLTRRLGDKRVVVGNAEELFGKPTAQS